MSVSSAQLAISTSGLRKTYRNRHGRHVAVDSLDLQVPVGGVHGFLGPNGSGKTTTIRMLLGLVRADSGTMQIFERPVPRALPEVVGRVGAIVESPKFFPAFTGRKNLTLLARGIGAPLQRVDEVLDATGLRDRASDRYKGYSLGMKQRLAIAATLLKSPDLLIFDEPTNGLDPAGIHEIRQTMRRLAAEGRTVLVSSHILTEVEQVADTVSIIGRGRLLATGPVADVIGDRTASVRVRVANPETALRILTEAGVAVRLEADVLIVEAEPDPARITYLLARDQLFVRELVPQRVGLEEVFLELTASTTLGSAAPSSRPNPPTPPLPTAPSEPTAPSDPAAPSDPTAPSDPAAPSDPTVGEVGR